MKMDAQIFCTVLFITQNIIIEIVMNIIMPYRYIIIVPNKLLLPLTDGYIYGESDRSMQL